MNCICAWCGNATEKDASAVNRAKRIGANLYCGRACFGLARRRKEPLTAEQLRTAKAEYDRARRERLLERIKAEKKAHYEKNRAAILEQMKVYRKKRMPKHVEYCRRPEYKAYKADYDRRFRADKQFGEFAEAFLLLQDVEREIESRASKYEIGLQNGTINKAQTRRREMS